MGYLIAGLLLALGLGIGIAHVPTDHDLAQRMEVALQQAVHPAAVHVALHRSSRFSRTVQQLNVDLDGFTAEALPLPLALPAPASVVALPGKPMHPVRPPKPPLYITIRTGTLHASHCSIAGLPFADMAWTLTDIKVPLASLRDGGFTISSFRDATGRAVLTEAGASALLAAHTLPLEHPTLQLTADGVRLHGFYTMGILKVPVTVSGRVTAHGGVLAVKQPAVQVDGITLPEGWTAKMTRACDPLVDINAQLHLPVPLSITRVTHGAGTLTLEASLQMAPGTPR